MKVDCPQGIIIRQYPNLSKKHADVTYYDAVNYFDIEGIDLIRRINYLLERDKQPSRVEEKRNRKLSRLLDQTEQLVHIKDSVERITNMGLNTIRILQVHLVEQVNRVHKIA